MGHICDPIILQGNSACYDHFGTFLTGISIDFDMPPGSVFERSRAAC
jgi:hypothetical protein